LKHTFASVTISIGIEIDAVLLPVIGKYMPELSTKRVFVTREHI